MFISIAVFQLFPSLPRPRAHRGLLYSAGNSAQYSVTAYRGRASKKGWMYVYPKRRKWQPTPGLLPGKSHGQGSLVGYHLWGHTESDTTERLTRTQCTCVTHAMYLRNSRTFLYTGNQHNTVNQLHSKKTVKPRY